VRIERPDPPDDDDVGAFVCVRRRLGRNVTLGVRALSPVVAAADDHEPYGQKEQRPNRTHRHDDLPGARAYLGCDLLWRDGGSDVARPATIPRDWAQIWQSRARGSPVSTARPPAWWAWISTCREARYSGSSGRTARERPPRSGSFSTSS